mgnify:CR=1 FL=1
MKSQKEMYYEAERKSAERNMVFMEMMDTLTNADLTKLVERHPQRWGQFRGFIGKLKD